MSYIIRDFNKEKDLAAVHRIWRETGWIDEDKHELAMDCFLDGGRGQVAELNNEAECLVVAEDATLQYLKADLKLSIVAAVTTSRIARKQGLAKKMTAKLVADEAERGALVSTLGIFEQGFYNQLGFGSGSYEHWISFDPADISVSRDLRPPIRLGEDDWKKLHSALSKRRRIHGGVTILSPLSVKAELIWTKNGFGLGYCDGPNGELSHFIWASAAGEQGPYDIPLVAYHTLDQFIELMALIKSLGDQVRLVKMREPAGIQMQDLIRSPFRSRIITAKSEFEHINRASSYWQSRILDLEGCLAATHLQIDDIRFNLELSDPITALLDEGRKWQGCAGAYTITLGRQSCALKGFEGDLPLLKASIGAFTRLWLGVRPASGLAATDDLEAPEELLQRLDEGLRLPKPHPDWDY